MQIDPRLRVDNDHLFAMQRLREIRLRIAAEKKRNEERRDMIWRSAALAAISWLVIYAYMQL